MAGDLQDCADHSLVQPSIVIDAIGAPVIVTGTLLKLLIHNSSRRHAFSFLFIGDNKAKHDMLRFIISEKLK